MYHSYGHGQFSLQLPTLSGPTTYAETFFRRWPYFQVAMVGSKTEHHETLKCLSGRWDRNRARDLRFWSSPRFVR
jgi:hypothetical protein